MEKDIEDKLRKEINYLTRLIQAHKAIKDTCMSSTGGTVSLTSVNMTSTGTMRRVRAGSVVPSWSDTGSINSHLPRCKPSSLLYKPAKVTSVVENYQINNLKNVRFSTKYHTKKTHLINSDPCDNLLDGKRDKAETFSCSIIEMKRNASTRDNETISVNINSKRMKRIHSSQNNGYSLKPNLTRKATTTTARNKLFCGNVPDRKKLKWRKRTSDAITHDSGTHRNENTILTSSHYRSVPIASNVSRKRRSDSEQSSFIIRKHKMTKVNSVSSASFYERRLQYLHNLSIHAHSPRVKRKIVSASFSCMNKNKWKSQHKVWKPHNIAPHANQKSEVNTCVSKSTFTRTRQNENMQVVSVLGAQYQLTQSGKSLKRISSSPVVLKSTPKKRKISFSSLSAKRQRSNHGIKQRQNRVWLKEEAYHKNQYCIFYNRFGHCNRGNKCTFLHDSKRVAICSKFLRGNCDKLDGKCPFSHNVSKEKMPVCSFFLRGLCTRQNCPYLHVSVGQDAELCLDFIRGFCSLGEKCEKQHVLDCPEYSKSGLCPRGKRCPFKHKRKRQRSESAVTTTEAPTDKSNECTCIKEPYPFKKLRHKLEKNLNDLPQTILSNQLITPSQLEFMPLETNKVPEFISL